MERRTETTLQKPVNHILQELEVLELPLKTMLYLKPCNILHQETQKLPKISRVLSEGHKNQREQTLASEKLKNLNINTKIIKNLKRKYTYLNP